MDIRACVREKASLDVSAALGVPTVLDFLRAREDGRVSPHCRRGIYLFPRWTMDNIGTLCQLEFSVL